MKRIVKYGLAQGVTFIIIMTAMNYWITGDNFLKALTAAVIVGLIVGVSNTFLSYRYAVPKYILDAMSIDIDADEEVRFSSLAHCTSVKEPVSGKLFLTNKRLIFKNHKQDKNNLYFSIYLQDIHKFDTFRTLRIFKNGLSIQTSQGEAHIFITGNVKQWLAHLKHFNSLEFEI